MDMLREIGLSLHKFRAKTFFTRLVKSANYSNLASVTAGNLFQFAKLFCFDREELFEYISLLDPRSPHKETVRANS